MKDKSIVREKWERRVYEIKSNSEEQMRGIKKTCVGVCRERRRSGWRGEEEEEKQDTIKKV